jgi:lysophospholipase L1-like esterase
MEKYLVGLVFVCIGLYLFVSFTSFYSFIGIKNLRPPQHTETTVIEGTGNPVRYVAIGDSLTDGVGVSDYKDTLPYLLANKFANGREIQLINLARAGDTTIDVLDRQLTKAVDSNPDIVTILIGVNDIHQRLTDTQFRDNYNTIVKKLKQTNAKIYAVSIPYIGSDKIVRFPFNILLDNRTTTLNEIIKNIADTNSIQYIDIYSINKSDKFYAEDLFHPSRDGYKEWLEAF